jgi:thioredoxin reductase (NADPH)
MTEETYDVLILGTGPAGLQAAIHAARRKVSVLVLGREQKSSAYRAHIENYCCISGVMGEVLLREGHLKAKESGALFLDEDVTELSREEGYIVARGESGKRFKGRTLILAMGISRKKLGVKGEKDFLGRGISYCVDCDANFYRDRPVAMIGCESAAVSGALTLLFFTREVHLICESLDVGEVLGSQLRESAIHLHEGRKTTEIQGDEGVEKILLDDGTALRVDGVFIELGAKGAVELAGPLGIRLDSETMRYVETNKKQETNLPGVYAAGDICGPPWQIAKAVGEGCVAGLEAAAYAKSRRGEGG